MTWRTGRPPSSSASEVPCLYHLHQSNMCWSAPPVPDRDVIQTLAEQELKSGQEGLLMVPFHSNPEPRNLTWYLHDLKYPLGLNESNERYTSRGWIRYVSKARVMMLVQWSNSCSESQCQGVQWAQSVRGSPPRQQAEGEGLGHGPQHLHQQWEGDNNVPVQNSGH